MLLRGRQAHEQVVVQTQGLQHQLRDGLAKILAGDGFDHHGQHPVRTQPVVVHPRSRRPLQRKTTHRLQHLCVVVPSAGRHFSVWKTGLVRDELQQGDVLFAICRKAGQMVCHAIGKA